MRSRFAIVAVEKTIRSPSNSSFISFKMATDDKYDRQLRLWGSNGQRALMNAHILLINADAVGTETLKNLVLPGIGQFTVMDDKCVRETDLENNFFVAASELGRSRAEVVTEMLSEMNADVRGFAIKSYPTDQDSVGTEFWTQFNLVIASNMSEIQLSGLSATCHTNKIPLMIVRSYGFIGYCRLILQGHHIIESKPDSDPYDLRILNPFEELEEYCSSFNLSEMESLEHGHTPYIVILYQAIMQWRTTHNNSLPSTFAEKEAFKQSIKAMSRDINSEQNYEEAVKEAYKVFTTKGLPAEVLQLLQDQRAKALSADFTEFEFLLRALQQFCDLSPQNLPPLGGSIPDMVSTTGFFVTLQRIYQRKAASDRLIFQGLLSNIILDSTRLPMSHTDMKMTRKSAIDISADTIDIFCKNVFNLRSLETRTFDAERSSPACEVLSNCIEDMHDDPPQTPIFWYLALRAVDRFQAAHSRLPGIEDHQLEKDTDDVWVILQQLAKEYGQIECPEQLSIDHAKEIVRYGGGELHPISALIGGVAAQEAVKIITHQYVPMDNTYIYNGIVGSGDTYQL